MVSWVQGDFMHCTAVIAPYTALLRPLHQPPFYLPSRVHLDLSGNIAVFVPETSSTIQGLIQLIKKQSSVGSYLLIFPAPLGFLISCRAEGRIPKLLLLPRGCSPASPQAHPLLGQEL